MFISGFSLIEVMVSISLISLMLLAFDAMQMTAVKTNQSAYQLTIIAQQLNNMRERLKALGELQGLDEQIRLWNQENEVVLPGSQGLVLSQYPDYRIQLCDQGKINCLEL